MPYLPGFKLESARFSTSNFGEGFGMGSIRVVGLAISGNARPYGEGVADQLIEAPDEVLKDHR
jgi:hypothetical protein